MRRVDSTTGKLIGVDEIRQRLNASIPEEAEIPGYPSVAVDEKPILSVAQEAILGQPWNDHGAWRQSWIIQDRPLIEVLSDRKEVLAALRYEKETSGITVGGAPIRTDRTSQALINGAYSYSLLNTAVVIDWKTTSGVWIQIDAPTIAAIAGSVAAHVQACFSAEKAHAQALGGLTTAAEIAAYDLNTGWPV